jgi:hypothetical protein
VNLGLSSGLILWGLLAYKTEIKENDENDENEN